MGVCVCVPVKWQHSYLLCLFFILHLFSYLKLAGYFMATYQYTVRTNLNFVLKLYRGHNIPYSHLLQPRLYVITRTPYILLLFSDLYSENARFNRAACSADINYPPKICRKQPALFQGSLPTGLAQMLLWENYGQVTAALCQNYISTQTRAPCWGLNLEAGTCSPIRTTLVMCLHSRPSCMITFYFLIKLVN